MFTIGEFSKITGLTIKALRLYHEKGIIEPHLVDQQTGYRYYNHQDAEKARVVRLLKGMMLGLGRDRRDSRRIAATTPTRWKSSNVIGAAGRPDQRSEKGKTLYRFHHQRRKEGNRHDSRQNQRNRRKERPRHPHRRHPLEGPLLRCGQYIGRTRQSTCTDT